MDFEGRSGFGSMVRTSSGRVEDALETEPLTREQRRSRRKRVVRARTISVRNPRVPSARGSQAEREPHPDRPRTRGDCIDGPRPCPWISCRHHLYLDVSRRTGSIKLNFPDLEPWQLEHSCALDVADDGGSTLEDVGALMNVTRERVRQLEIDALHRLEMLRDMLELRGYEDDSPMRASPR
jgi:hypothetical protein